MDKKDILKILKLLKKDKKKRKKIKKFKKLVKPYENIATLQPKIISQNQYQPGFQIPKFIDYNKNESEQFSEYKKSRGLLPSETRGFAPSELELYKEFDKVKKISPSDINDLLINKNIESLTLEKQKYLDKLKIAEEKTKKALEQQELKTKTKIEGIRNPKKVTNLILPPPETFLNNDNIGLETAIGGTSDDFIISQSAIEQTELPSLISVGSAPIKPKRKYIKVKKP